MLIVVASWSCFPNLQKIIWKQESKLEIIPLEEFIYNLSSQDIVVAIGLLYVAESNNELIHSTYLKSILPMDKELFESSISRLENKKLIRIDESFSEDDLVKIVEYEIHF